MNNGETGDGHMTICLPDLNLDINTLSLEPQMKYLGQCQEKSSAVSLKVLGCSEMSIPHQGAQLQKNGLQYNQPTPSNLQITHHNSETKNCQFLPHRN